MRVAHPIRRYRKIVLANRPSSSLWARRIGPYIYQILQCILCMSSKNNFPYLLSTFEWVFVLSISIWWKNNIQWCVCMCEVNVCGDGSTTQMSHFVFTFEMCGRYYDANALPIHSWLSIHDLSWIEKFFEPQVKIEPNLFQLFFVD